MRKKRNYFASHASLTGQGASKQEANADLERQIDWALEHRSPYVEVRFGQLIVIAADASGWHSALVRQDDLATHGFKPCWTMCGQGEFEPILRSARLNAAQSAWSRDAMDAEIVEQAGLDKSGQGELQSWIGFQRKYAEAKSIGKTDGEAFDIANGRAA